VHTDYREIIGKNGSTISDGPLYRLFASVDAATCPATGGGSIAGLVRTNGVSGPEFAVCDTPLAIGVWTHLTLTYDGANLSMYRNGVLRATVAASGIIEPSTGALSIATSQFGEAFQGALDEMRVYNYGLPLTGGTNTVPGAACARGQIASIVGDMNCSVVPPVSIVTIAIPASPTGLSIGHGTTLGFGH
jgi:hypothetical protein